MCSHNRIASVVGLCCPKLTCFDARFMDLA